MGQRPFEDAHTLLFVAGFGGRQLLQFFVDDMGVEGSGAFGPGDGTGDGLAGGRMAAARPARPIAGDFFRRPFRTLLTPVCLERF